MKTIFENVIKRGGYDLADMINKIDIYHIEGKISDDERDELYDLARVKPEAKYDIKAEIEHLWAAIRELQNDSAISDDDADDGSIADWKQPTGAHDAYSMGEIMMYTDGHVYESLINNNVWSPDVLPSAWKKLN